MKNVLTVLTLCVWRIQCVADMWRSLARDFFQRKSIVRLCYFVHVLRNNLSEKDRKIKCTPFSIGWYEEKNKTTQSSLSSFGEKSDVFRRQTVSCMLPVPFMCSCFLIGGFLRQSLRFSLAKQRLSCSPGFDVPITQTQIHMQNTMRPLLFRLRVWCKDIANKDLCYTV